MFNEDNIMRTTLRYLLMVIAVLSVLSLSAQTRQYSAKHYSSYEQATYTMQVNPQMPTATMDYSRSDYMTSGSTLPQAVLDGPTTTYDEGNSGPGHRPGNIRRGLDDDDKEEAGNKPGQAFPIGDGRWALIVLAAMYSAVALFRRKKA